MSTSARAHLHVTTGATASLLLIDGFVHLNTTNLPALVTATDSLVQFDSPVAGQLRYTGTAKFVALSADLSTHAPAVGSENFAYRISVNGVTLGGSEQVRSQSALVGLVGVSLSGLIELSSGDVVEIAVATSADGDLEIVALSMLAQEVPLDIPVSAPAAIGGLDWALIEDTVDATLIGSAMAEAAIYEPLPAAPVAIRVIFDESGYEPDLDMRFGVTTGKPKLSLRNADIGRVAKKGDPVTVRGVDYVVQSVLPGGTGWSKCQLHEAA